MLGERRKLRRLDARLEDKEAQVVTQVAKLTMQVNGLKEHVAKSQSPPKRLRQQVKPTWHFEEQNILSTSGVKGAENLQEQVPARLAQTHAHILILPQGAPVRNA